MSPLLRLVNDADLDPVTRAILAHLEFVTIHPVRDGNGRIARFLMNIDQTPFAALLLDYTECAATRLATRRD